MIPQLTLADLSRLCIDSVSPAPPFPHHASAQRAISPSTPDGAQTLRSTLLTEDNKLQWQRFEQVEFRVKGVNLGLSV